MAMCSKSRFFAVLLCVALLFSVFVCMPVNGAETYPTMFVNDTPWYGESEYPSHTIFKTVYVPISYFQRINGVTVQESDQFVNVIISYGRRYMSFDTENGSVTISDGSTYHLETYLLYGGERYVPVAAVCEYFSFSYEILGGNYIRICDGSQVLTFTALLSIYSPNYRDHLEVPPAPSTGAAHSVYLTFEGDISLDDAETASLLLSIGGLLSAYDVPATFFLTGGQVQSAVREIYALKAGGCEIALHTMTHNETYFAQDISYFIDELNAENDLLYELLNFRSRIARAPGGSHTRKFVITKSEYNQIKRAGYLIWDYNCDLYEVKGVHNLADAALSMIESNDVSVLRLAINRNTVDALPLLLEYLKESKNCSVLTISPSLKEINKIV